MPTIKIENLIVEYGKKNKVLALNSLSTTFIDSKVNVIVGKSGCGKTSLLRSILGLQDYKGEIYFDNENARYLSIKERNIGYVSQNIALYPFYNLFKNIANPITNTLATGEEIRNRVNEVAQLLKITECLSRKPSQVSIGQAQRAAIGRAIIKKPNFYVFDEPFCNLDEQTSNDLRVEVSNIFKMNNSTVIFVTHDLKEALAIGDYIYVMDEGQIVDKGNQEEILHSNNEITRELFKNL